MKQISLVVTAFAFALTAVPAFSQDAIAVLRRASAAMGADDLKTLSYAGSGTGGGLSRKRQSDSVGTLRRAPSLLPLSITV